MAESPPTSILVTGGAGFVGSSLAVHLKKAFSSARVTAMDNLHRKGAELNLPRLREADVEFHRGDIRSAADFPPGPFDTVLECSAEPSVLAGYDGPPDYLFETNLAGTYRCLEQARRWASRVVFFSTSRVYPIEPLERHPWREAQTRFQWEESGTPGLSAGGVSEAVPMSGYRSLYGFTKFASEALIEEYRAGFGLKAVVNRCGLISGPWQMGKAEQGIMAHWIFAHAWNLPLRYTGYGGKGKQVRDVLHIADLCDLVTVQLSGFDRWEGWLGNVGGGLENTFSLLELTGLCEERLGTKIRIGSDPADRPMDLRIFYADCARLAEQANWRPKRTVRDVVDDLASWVEANRPLLEPVVRG